MQLVRRRAVIALGVVLVVCLATGRPVAQDAPGALALLDRYARGDFDAVVSVLETTDKKDFGHILNELKKGGPDWIAAGGAADRERRELAAATFALEAARASEWLEWKRVMAGPQLSERRTIVDETGSGVGELKLGGDGFVNADLLYWQASPKLLEWGCTLARSTRWPDATQRIWQLAALAVAERAEDSEFLLGSPFAVRGNSGDEPEHLRHASFKLPNERRIALAQGIALEWKSFPESVKGHTSDGDGVREALTVFANLSKDDVVGAEASVRLGALRLRLGDEDQALKLFADAEANTRDRFLVYLARYYRGQALERKQQWPEAEAAYRGALATIPRAQSASIAFAALLSRRGAGKDAAAVVSANLSAHPQPVDPVRAYGDGDDRFWPELIARLRRQIAPAAEKTSGVVSVGTTFAPTETTPDVFSPHGPAVAEFDEQQSQAQAPVFRSASDLVTIGVAVRASGSPVGGLKADDFLVLDNGVPQKVESLDGEAVPADITVLVETGADIKDYLGSVNNQMQKILTMVRPDDRVRVLGIDTYVNELLPLQRAGDRPPVRKLIVGGMTSAHDALAAALMQNADPQRRQLIIAVTDAVDSNSTLTAEVVRDIAKRSGAELHIAYMTLACECPPPIYTTSAERLAGVLAMTGGQRARFWRPYSQSAGYRFTHDYAVLREAAEATGGKAYLPGIFTDRTAAGIFQKVYDDYRHSYVIRFAPQGVKREGWHDVTVTLPKYPNVDISARRGYSIDTPTAGAPASVFNPAPDPPTYQDVADRYRGAPDALKAIQSFRAAGNMWPATPALEAVISLELADAAFRSGRDEARLAAAQMLIQQRRLVEQPIAPDEFERVWVWAALASLEGMIRPALAEPFVNNALKRFPGEPRLLLGRAILADQHAPIGVVDPPDPQSDGRIAEISALYDAAIDAPDTTAEARIRKAWFLHRMGHHADALALLDAAEPRATDPVLLFWRDLFRGQMLDALGRQADAVRSFRAALAAFPRSQSANVGLMNALVRSGGRDEAKQLAELVHTLAPTDDDPYWMYWSADYRFVEAAARRLLELARTSAPPETIK